ncbi:MAG: HNH endonuclease domain-containing protein [Kiritimatiellae bacterium]|nr:HNH endonuclease domain-containing protein [Kiritimatiellia bacterium]
MSATRKRDLILSFDIGHSSIGWNVLMNSPDGLAELGLGTVIFEADGCLASKRRDFRRQRRTIRSRRQRIEWLEKVFLTQGLLNPKQIEAKHNAGGGNSAPWLLSAAVLAGKGKCVLSAEELFDVLRWYAHNRGYDGNRRWSGTADENKEDTEREQAALNLMEKHGTTTMAETVSAQLGLAPDGHKRASMNYYKGRDIGAAFPRSVVTAEVKAILQIHAGKLKGCTEEFMQAVCGEADEAWKAIQTEGIRMAKNFKGSLLFGQKVPRFDNRILSFCPVSNTPTPLKSCREFMDYRCAMFLAAVRVAAAEDKALRALNAAELKELWDRIHLTGYMPAGEFKKAVRKMTGCTRDNLDGLMVIEDAGTNLITDPALKLVHSNTVLKIIWPEIPEDASSALLARLRAKQRITVADILAGAGTATDGLNTAVDSAYKKERKKIPDKTRWIERKSFHAEYDSGRAPYSRSVMTKAVQEVLSGKDPRAEGGCLYVTSEMSARQAGRSLDKMTNNHLVRHRLLILNRLMKDILNEFAAGDKDRVETIVVEVNREVASMSGKTIKEIKTEEGRKRADHKRARKIMEDAVQEAGSDAEISAGLIRKARIAEDLGWTCPYTGKKYGPLDLIHKQVDMDHIIPRSERLSDSMAGMVITFSEVNRWKDKRTAWQFVEQEQGKPVQGNPALTITSLNAYREFVEKLKTAGGVDEDQARRKARKQYLLMPDYIEKSFTPRDLTISSYVTKMAVQQITNTFNTCKRKPQIVSLPGRLTGEARKSWKLTGLLHAVNSEISGSTLKDEVRGMTHLHHALDASVMGLLAANISDLSDGSVWQLLLKRHLTRDESRYLKEHTRRISIDSEGRPHLQDIPKTITGQLQKLLAERRVVQHIPASMTGLHVKLNTHGILGMDDQTGKVILQQKKEGKHKPELDSEHPVKVLGFAAPAGSKLKKQKGARIIDQNYGVALTLPEPQIIPWHKVWPRLNEIREKTGKWPQVLRKGMIINVPKGRYKGTWKIFSVKNEQRYMALDMGAPDGCEATKRSVNLTTLTRDSMQIIRTKLTGNGLCRITSSISTAPTSG